MKGAVVVALAVMIVDATGLSAAQDRSLIVNPSWAQQPSANEMADAYPEFATLIGLKGRVTLECVARPDGVLTLCETVAVSPEGVGFDRAALSLIPSFRVNPRQVDGQDEKSAVRFSIHFSLAPRTPPPSWTGAEPSAEHLATVAQFLTAMGVDAPELTEEDMDDVDADRRDRVRAILRQVYDEYLPRMKEAGALTFARLVTPEQLAAARAGGAPPPRPPEMMLERASDRAEQLMFEVEDRICDIYCAEYTCPVAREE